MRDGGDFTIIVTRKEGVAAGQPMHEHWLPLSNLDLIFPPIDVSVFFCYKKPHQSVNGGDDLPLSPWLGL